MKISRSSGVLLHPSSLPGPFGIGDFGKECYTFIDFLLFTNQKFWQINPLGPTGYGDSPYQNFSSFAGNPLLINLQKLETLGLLDLSTLPKTSFSAEVVSYEAVQKFKKKAFLEAYQTFTTGDFPLLHKRFLNFCQEQKFWLNDFVLFMAIKDHFGGKPWYEWEPNLVRREEQTLETWRLKLGEDIGFHQFLQFLFFQQWQEVRAYCKENGVQILGDLPLYPAYDSVDVWVNPELFVLDPDLKMTYVAGVPPDYFSKTGQLWGNPLYRWERMREDQYKWWKTRIRQTLKFFDWVRLDHFRGFESYWEVPMGHPDAQRGRWVAGPRDHFFLSLEEEFGHLPFIAEDLGIIPPEVNHLREMFSFPGMKILQFAFNGEAHHLYLPHNFEKDCVVYTGTHDNESIVSWWESTNAKTKEQVLRYLGKQTVKIHREMIRLASSSAANLALFPLQDILGLGAESRMNTPGKAEGNWTWRFAPELITKEVMEFLGNVTEIFGRS